MPDVSCDSINGGREVLAEDIETDIDNIEYTIVGGDGSLPTYSTGGAYAYVMTQDPESIENAKTLMNAVLEGQDLQTDEEGAVSVAPGE